MSEPRLLTQSEVCALPDGARVSVIWSGGNGAHEYEVHKYCGVSLACLPGERVVVGDLESVGQKPLTEVRLIEEAGDDPA